MNTGFYSISNSYDSITISDSTNTYNTITSIQPTLSGYSGSYYSNGTAINPISWNPVSTSPNITLGDTGIDMIEGTDIKIGKRSLKEFMEKMEKRLAILVPDPEKLEHFDCLKKAYEHYKTLESLCEIPKEEKE